MSGVEHEKGRPVKLGIRLYQPLRDVAVGHSFLMGNDQGGETDVLGFVTVKYGETTFRQLRPIVQEIRDRGMQRRSPIYKEAMYHFNHQDNFWQRPERDRREYLFGVPTFGTKVEYNDGHPPGWLNPEVPFSYSSVHMGGWVNRVPKLVKRHEEGGTIVTDLCVRDNENYVIMLVQYLMVGPGCGNVCRDKRCRPCGRWQMLPESEKGNIVTGIPMVIGPKGNVVKPVLVPKKLEERKVEEPPAVTAPVPSAAPAEAGPSSAVPLVEPPASKPHADADVVAEAVMLATAGGTKKSKKGKGKGKGGGGGGGGGGVHGDARRTSKAGAGRSRGRSLTRGSISGASGTRSRSRSRSGSRTRL